MGHSTIKTFAALQLGAAFQVLVLIHSIGLRSSMAQATFFILNDLQTIKLMV
jgi:hypothetical protein